jgi:hypothetical protein
LVSRLNFILARLAHRLPGRGDMLWERRAIVIAEYLESTGRNVARLIVEITISFGKIFPKRCGCMAIAPGGRWCVPFVPGNAVAVGGVKATHGVTSGLAKGTKRIHFPVLPIISSAPQDAHWNAGPTQRTGGAVRPHSGQVTGSLAQLSVTDSRLLLLTSFLEYI